jgi:hypothetical protein
MRPKWEMRLLKSLAVSVQSVARNLAAEAGSTPADAALALLRWQKEQPDATRARLMPSVPEQFRSKFTAEAAVDLARDATILALLTLDPAGARLAMDRAMADRPA